MQSSAAVAERLNDLGYTQKRRVTRGGKERGGRRWDKDAIYTILRNPLYIGKMRSKDGDLHDAEHAGIVAPEVFSKASESLRQRGSARLRRTRRNAYPLSGILRCGPCGAPMWASLGKGRNGVRYRYYRCRQHQQSRGACPTGIVPAGEVEKVVIDQVKQVARRGDIQQRVLAHLCGEAGASQELTAGKARLVERLGTLNAEAKRLLGAFREAGAGGGKLLATRLGEIEAEMDTARAQLQDVEQRIADVTASQKNGERIASLLDSFEALWEALLPPERRELIRLLIREVVIEPDGAGLRIVFNDVGAPAAEQKAAP